MPVSKRNRNRRKDARCCARKLRWPSKETAEASMTRTQKKTARPLIIYQCLHCSGWHVAHKKAADNNVPQNVR